MRLAVAVEHRAGDFRLSVSFAAEARVLAVVGPSGAGKTTLLKILAGLIRPVRGRVALAGAVLLDTEAGVACPAHRRGIGFVFQDDRLFPHLTVAQNLGYGAWVSRRRLPPERCRAIIDILGIGALTGRRVAGLSGGERQRVGIGRALLAAPRLLLMDEPLAALDEARRLDILPLIEDIRDRAGVPIVYVSHARAEVARLADAVVELPGGRLL